MSELIRHKVLGLFRKTGVTRRPLVGEYYLGNITKSVCLAAKEVMVKAEILVGIVKCSAKVVKK